MIDDIISNKYEAFLKRFENADSRIKQQIHFNSVKNICKEILIIKNKKDTEKYKESILEYFSLVEKMNFPIEKITSLKLYNECIYESGRYLMYKSGFISNGSLLFITSIGIVIDFLVYAFDFYRIDFFVPVFSLALIFYSFKVKRKAIKNGKYFIRNW